MMTEFNLEEQFQYFLHQTWMKGPGIPEMHPEAETHLRYAFVAGVDKLFQFTMVAFQFMPPMPIRDFSYKLATDIRDTWDQETFLFNVKMMNQNENQ